MKITPTDTLVIVDPQNDFCPPRGYAHAGRLAVEGGHEIMPGIVELARKFHTVGATIVITQDWHPANHKSFASNHDGAEPFSITQMPYGEQVLWPDHCVQGDEGGDFVDEISQAEDMASLIIRKGMNPEIDSYSAFFENDKVTSTGLAGFLRERGINRVFFVGLAYDFCVGYSALDAVRSGFNAVVVKSLTRAIAMPVQLAVMGDDNVTTTKMSDTVKVMESNFAATKLEWFKGGPCAVTVIETFEGEE